MPQPSNLMGCSVPRVTMDRYAAGEPQMIRSMNATDVGSVADLAMSTRLLQQGWEPQLWSIAPTGRTAHQLVIERQLEVGGACGLVDEGPHGVTAAVLALDLEAVPSVAGGPVWTADDFYVTDPSE